MGDWPGKKNPHFSFDDNFFVIIIGLPRLLFYVTKAIIQFLQLFVILLHCGSQCTHILVQVSDIISWYSYAKTKCSYCTLVRLAETLTWDWLNANEPWEMVLTITLLHILHWQTRTLTGTLLNLQYKLLWLTLENVAQTHLSTDVNNYWCLTNDLSTTETISWRELLMDWLNLTDNGQT